MSEHWSIMSLPQSYHKAPGDSASLDEDDSGNSSVDEFHSAADDRERVNHLETAVTWIREEVVSLH